MPDDPGFERHQATVRVRIEAETTRLVLLTALAALAPTLDVQDAPYAHVLERLAQAIAAERQRLDAGPS